jgi:N-acetylglucosamine-6-phosphate deacetylase
MVRLAIRAKGVDGIVIVSDMMAAAGLGDGTYQLAGQEVQVEGMRAHLSDGTLAGSVLTMDQAIRNLVEWGGVTPAEAFHMATAVPARVIGEHSRGRLVSGSRADLSLWTSSLELTHTVLGGRVAWEVSGTAPQK